MSLKRRGLICALLATGAGIVWLLPGERRTPSPGVWNADAIRASFETVVPAH
jgi:hypothetical protein